MRPILLALALALSAAAQAPDAPPSPPADTLALAPGDGALDTGWLAPGTRRFVIRLVQPIQQDAGTAEETVTLDGGVVTRTTRVEIPMQGMVQTDVLVADAATLAPITHTSTGGPSDASLEFLDEGIAGLLTPRTGDPKTVLLETDGPVFDSAWLGEVAQSLPLTPGLVAVAPAYATQSPDATFTAVFTVGEPEDGAVPVAVEMGPLTMTHWVDAETRALRRTAFSPQRGVLIEIAPADE